MKKTDSIGIIGSGNVAEGLAVSFHAAGIPVHCIVSRNARTGKKLAKSVDAVFNPTIDTAANISIWFVCIPDDALNAFTASLKKSGATFVHTSGSVPLSIFTGNSSAGVFYPLQSFTKGVKVNFKSIPVCIEASDAATEKKLKQLARKISGNVRVLNSEERAHLHLAAVFANNFSNACFSMAELLLKEYNLPFNLLSALIKTTADKALHDSPMHVQTGPAKRNDEKILRKHKTMLKAHPDLLRIYKEMSVFIGSHAALKK